MKRELKWIYRALGECAGCHDIERRLYSPLGDELEPRERMQSLCLECKEAFEKGEPFEPIHRQ
jgi:hypothetical protein